MISRIACSEDLIAVGRAVGARWFSASPASAMIVLLLAALPCQAAAATTLVGCTCATDCSASMVRATTMFARAGVAGKARSVSSCQPQGAAHARLRGHCHAKARRWGKDPTLWQDGAGDFHILTHAACGHHFFSSDGREWSAAPAEAAEPCAFPISARMGRRLCLGDESGSGCLTFGSRASTTAA